MKAIAWGAVALTLLCLGCAQGGSKKSQESSTTGRLQNLEASFAKFQEQERQDQEQRRARDADIEARLKDIAARLERLSPGSASRAQGLAAGKSAKAERAQLRERTPTPMLGQVVPLSAVSGPGVQPAPAQPAAALTQPAPATAPVQPAQAQPLSPQAGAVQPAASKAGRPGPQPFQAPASAVGAPAPAKDSLGLNPPVVTLGPEAARPAGPQPTAQASPGVRQPVPYDSQGKGVKGKGRQAVASAPEAQAPMALAEPASPAGQSAAPPAVAPAAAPAASAVAPAAPPAAAPGATPAAPPAAAPGATPATRPAAPAASGAATPDPNIEAAQLYTDAMRAVTANKNEDGRRKLNELMTKYPSSEKVPLALYWVGESYMNDRSYNQAILAFKDVTSRYPKSFKAPESVYKVAEAYERLGDKSNAVFHLKLLVDEYPGSELVGKAKQKLKQLGQ